MDTRTLGERLRWGRHRLGLSQEALARDLNVSKNAVARWEGGESEPKLANAKALAKRLGVRIEWLIDGEGTAEAA